MNVSCFHSYSNPPGHCQTHVPIRHEFNKNRRCPTPSKRPGSIAMVCFSKLSSQLTVLSIALTAFARTGTIKDIEHVVLFMQENRAWDHYFGTMRGVRGFADPNINIASNGLPSWFQMVDGTLSNKTHFLAPFYINAAGGNLSEATQCMNAGSNGWQANHRAMSNGNNNDWALGNSPFSMGYYKREDLPYHFALGEAFTMGDMYAQAVIASTDPNRVFWGSGSINIPGGHQTPDQGGPTVDNNETPGCEGPGHNISCFPMKWKTFPEYLEDADVTWQVWQDLDNFDDNPFAWFSTYQNAPANSVLAEKGTAFLGLNAFYSAAASGTLPQVSYIIGPTELSEHPPNGPRDGGFLQQQIVNAVLHSPKYSSTVLLISYDETGGWADHVVPITSRPGTAGEWLDQDPFDPTTVSGPVVSGPGFRLPFTAVSPWTRGGYVYTAHSDHGSQIMFLEKWLTAIGKKGVITDQLNPWRRENMADLTQMFDFEHPDFSIPDLPVQKSPQFNAQGISLGTSLCGEKFPDPQPPIPYGAQTRENSLFIEDGFKPLRGALTEGRYIVFESHGFALAYNSLTKSLGVARASPEHNVDAQRFILHATAPPPATTFMLQFAGSPTVGYVDENHRLTTSVNEAAVFNITDMGSGKGYTILQVSKEHKFLSLLSEILGVLLGDEASTFQLFSVTKSTDAGTGFPRS
ncbi:phosphoesterase-domain-containing protein [Ramaria rubella]|nr:phosphoesterase-domain-containing protein [Ramaria rubella]